MLTQQEELLIKLKQIEEQARDAVGEFPAFHERPRMILAAGSK